MASHLADTLDRLVATAQSVGDGGQPADDEHKCVMCFEKTTEARMHEPWCAWRIARTEITPADLAMVRKLANVLRGMP